MEFELIDCKGIVAAETEADRAALRSDGFVRVIHLDANLVLDFARIGGGRATPDSAALGGLLHLAAATQTSIDSDLAVGELAAGAARIGDLNRKSKLRAELSAGIRAVESHHGLRKGTVVVRHIGQAEVNSYEWVRTGYYTHLLYIEQLAKQRPGKAAAVENVATYIDWANNRLKNVSGHCSEIEEKLLPFEAALRKMGAGEHLLPSLRPGARLSRLVDEIHKSFGLIIGTEHPANDEEAAIVAARIIDHVRDILGIKELTQLRLSATRLALGRVSQARS